MKPYLQATLIITLTIFAIFSVPEYVQADVVPSNSGSAGLVVGRPTMREKATLVNNTGQTAYDVHIDVSLKDPSAFYNGLRATGHWGSIDVALGGPQIATIDLAGNKIANGGSTAILLESFTNEKNEQWLNYHWTDSVGVAIVPARGPLGTRIGIPKPGRSWMHEFTFFNDRNDSVFLSNLKLLGTMDYFNDLSEDISWDSISNILTNPVEVFAGQTYTYDFITNDPLWGGHVYFGYDVDGGEFAILGDHPVPTPEPSTILLLSAGIAGLMWKTRRTKKH